jgi:hypothetical protein
MNLQTPSLRDANLTVTKAFAAAGANNTSDGIALGDYVGTTISGTYARDIHLELQVIIPAALALATDKSLTITPMSSQDDAVADAYAAIPTLGAVTVTGIATNVLPITEGAGYEIDASGNIVVSWPLPRKLEKYVAVNVAVESAGGTLTASSYTVTVVGFI